MVVIHPIPKAPKSTTAYARTGGDEIVSIMASPCGKCFICKKKFPPKHGRFCKQCFDSIE